MAIEKCCDLDIYNKIQGLQAKTILTSIDHNKLNNIVCVCVCVCVCRPFIDP